MYINALTHLFVKQLADLCKPYMMSVSQKMSCQMTHTTEPINPDMKQQNTSIVHAILLKSSTNKLAN